MDFGISEGKGRLKHGSRPWLGMDIFWNCPFCNPEFLFLFTCEGNIQYAKKVLRLAMEHRTVINKIVFTSPEVMVEFSGGKS